MYLEFELYKERYTMNSAQRKTRMLFDESIACWYQLRWRSSDTTIIVRIHEAYLAGLEDVSSTAPVVAHLEKMYGLRGDLLNSEFCGSFSADTFGFNRALVKQPRRSGDPFVEYWAKVPVIWFDTHEACQYCDGQKKQPLSGAKCYSCNGSGKKRECDWTSAHALQSSLVILLWILDLPPEIDLPTTQWQTLTVRCNAEPGQSGSGVFGVLSPDAVDYIKSLPQARQDALICEVSEAVMIAYATMMGKPSDPYAFHKCLDARGIHFSCPGNATGIDGSFDRVAGGRCGFEFSPHNVDSPIQGLSLFAGIAKLSELTQFWLKREVSEIAEK